MIRRRLLQAAAATAALALAAPASAASLYAANGHYYEFVPGSVSWHDALAAAAIYAPMAGYDSYLVTITDEGEDDFVKALVGDAVYVWAAGTDEETEGVWKWAAGPELGQIFFGPGAPPGAYTDWNPGEPNNSGGEDYLHFNANAPDEWNDVFAAFTGAGGYVVEYSRAGGVIPEPGTWALMIAGFGLAGAALRRRREVAAA